MGDLDVEARRDDSSFVEAAIQLDDYLSSAVVIDNLEFTDVAYCRGQLMCKTERKTGDIVSAVNAKPTGNRMRCLVMRDYQCFGALKREASGSKVPSIVVITPKMQIQSPTYHVAA